MYPISHPRYIKLSIMEVEARNFFLSSDSDFDKLPGSGNCELDNFLKSSSNL